MQLGNSNFSQISAKHYNVSHNLAENWNSQQNPANPNISPIFLVQPDLFF